MDATSAQGTYESAKFTCEAVTALTTRWYPYRRWFTVLTEGSTDNNSYYYICYDCFAQLDVKKTDNFKGYNEMVATLALNNVANSTIDVPIFDLIDDSSQNAQ